MAICTGKKRRIRAALASGIAALAISACAGTSGVSDQLTTKSLAQSKTAVALLKAEIVGQGCANSGNITLGRKDGDVYQPVKTLVTYTGALSSGNDVMQVELAAGEYHVINIACAYQSGNRIYTVQVGKQEGGGLFGIGAQHKKSFGTFTLAPGEIVNLGYLRIVGGLFGDAAIEVTALRDSSLAILTKDKPTIAAQMQTRHMTIVKSPKSPEEQKRLCELHQKLRELIPTLNQPSPAECSQPATIASAAPRLASKSTPAKPTR